MEGEYSKLEKDFLGNERMVHYGADGTAISASTVSRAADGSMSVGEPSPLDVSTPNPQTLSSNASTRPSYPLGTLATIGIASFVVATLGALLILNLNRGGNSAAERFNREVYRSQVTIPEQDPADSRVPGPTDLPPDGPPPEQDQGMNQSPPGERDRPRIQLRDETPDAPTEPEITKPEREKPPADTKPSDPIDLRGDGEESR